MSKIRLFEYFLKKLVEWYCETYRIEISQFNNHEYNDLSKLKVIKLHFFACSANDQALDHFNDFHAMPYGHVESEVYNHLTDLLYCTVNNRKLQITNLPSFAAFSPDNHEIMDVAIQNLKMRNEYLIKLEPFELVELSHRWYSWRTTFKKARDLGLFSKPIESNILKKEEKFYSLY